MKNVGVDDSYVFGQTENRRFGLRKMPRTKVKRGLLKQGRPCELVSSNHVTGQLPCRTTRKLTRYLQRLRVRRYLCWRGSTRFTRVWTQTEAQSPGCLRNTGPACGDLKDGERGALRIGYDGHPPDILKIGRRHAEFCPELLGLGRGGVAIGNTEVG